ncbi:MULTISPECIES: M12 family metallopeptidase [unclassified Pseudomonas]|uniref:M12 family metallopeptidase n=1 Tax=Pseudomonas sp. MYb327 TaxID=2745230 RepID=A0AAU8DWX5_9PSED
MTTLRPCLIKAPTDNQLSYQAAISENPANGSTYSRHNRRTVSVHTKYWMPGRTLKIAISDYNDDGFDIVKNAIEKWLPYVNLKFEFIELPDNDELYVGDIRIYLTSLSDNSGHSSIGTDALTVPSTLHTMQLGTDYTSAGYEALVLHEFGHALGFLHEHQHPDASIPWNREATYLQYALEYGWSRAHVDGAVFPLPRDANQSYEPYDRHSIMHYNVLNICTVGDWEQPTNLQLSDGDKAAARKAYP